MRAKNEKKEKIMKKQTKDGLSRCVALHVQWLPAREVEVTPAACG